jgi:hypothetical protein
MIQICADPTGLFDSNTPARTPPDRQKASADKTIHRRERQRAKARLDALPRANWSISGQNRPRAPARPMQDEM